MNFPNRRPRQQSLFEELQDNALYRAQRRRADQLGLLLTPTQSEFDEMELSDTLMDEPPAYVPLPMQSNEEISDLTASSLLTQPVLNNVAAAQAATVNQQTFQMYPRER
jgi:hypothetical protein